MAEGSGRLAIRDAQAVLENIRRRRSVRRYTSEPVPEELLRTVLEAANLAPSAHNRQAWRFLVVRAEAKDRMARLVSSASAAWPRKMRVLLRLGAQIISSAPLVVAIFKTGELVRELEGEEGQKAAEFFHLMEIQSASAAVENLMLAAASLGLGTVWLGAVCLVQEQIAAELGQKGELLAVVPIGWPAPAAGGSPRKKPLDEVLLS